MKILVTGSSGLIGCEANIYFDHEGHEVVGVANNLRREFFGPPWTRQRTSGILKDAPGICAS
jgi:CDP-paratose 2-epimerase